MTKAQAQAEEEKKELPLAALMLECNTDRYKLVYAAIRWAKELKQKESLPEGVPLVALRSLREILTDKVQITDIENLPILARTPPPPPPSQPTLTLSIAPEEPAEKSEKAEPKED